MTDNSSESLPLSVGDLAEFGRLFEEHRPRLFAMLTRRIDPRFQSRFDPDDVLQDAYFMAQKKWRAFLDKGTMSAYSWLYRITLDCLIEYCRKTKRNIRDPCREVAWPDESEVAAVIGLADTGTRPSQAAQRQEFKRRMQHAMGLLPVGDRDILCMRHYDQLSHQEISEVLGITTNTAAVRYVRAVERLRRVWHESAFDEGQENAR
jgi:RNA polymerase sigma-70 factor (ECF subfamily)